MDLVGPRPAASMMESHNECSVFNYFVVFSSVSSHVVNPLHPWPSASRCARSDTHLYLFIYLLQKIYKSLIF